MAKVIDLIFKVKIARMILNLKEKEMNISSLARASGCTYVYATKILHELEHGGVIELHKDRKFQIAKLTENGMVIASHIDDIFRRSEPPKDISVKQEVKQD